MNKKPARNKTVDEIEIEILSLRNKKLNDRIDNICNLVDLEWNGMMTREELVYRLTELCEKKHIVIELNKELSYRFVEAKYYEQAIKEGKSGRGKMNGGNGYFLQYWEHDEWVDVTDLTDLKIWEYNKLVDEIQKHYPDYPIEYLEGRFV